MPPREKNKQKSRPPLLRGQQQLTFARTAATLETKVAQLQQRAARRKRQLQKEEEEEEDDDDDDDDGDEAVAPGAQAGAVPFLSNSLMFDLA